MQNKIENTALNSEEIKEMYSDAEKAVFIALRARAEKSGLTFLQDLQNAQYPDKTARNATEIVNRIKPLEDELDELKNKNTEYFKLVYKRTTLLPDPKKCRCCAFYVAPFCTR